MKTVTADLNNSGWTGRTKKNVFWANYDASNPVESSGIVGKNFPFDLRIEVLHRFEPEIALSSLEVSPWP